MKKIILLSIQVFAFTILLAQDILIERSLDMQLLFNEKRESYPVVNEEDGTLALFLMDYKTIQAQLLDRNFNKIASLADFQSGSGFTDLLGCNVNQGVYNLFFTNKKKDKFYCKTMDMVNLIHSDHEIPLKLKGEKYLECVSYKNRFYLLTVVKSAAILKIYEFANNENYQVKVLDLSLLKFSKSKYSTLYDILIKGPANKLTLDFQKVDIQNPNSLEITSHAIKLYSYDNKLFLTFDNEPQETKILTISLDDYSFKYNSYKQGMIDCGEDVIIGSNSFLYKNILFQVEECSQELYFSVRDISSGAVLKDFRVTKNEEITFKNTPFIQEGGTTLLQQNSKKELENTKILLRKIAAGYIGVSAYSSSGSFVVTIGGYYEVQSGGGGGMMMASPGGVSMSPSGNMVSSPVTFSYNPSMNSYRSYKNSRSVYFKSLLDSITLGHLNGELIPNAFDKISDFSEPLEKHIVSETIFKLQDFYVFGYFNTDEKKYYLRKFTD